MSPAAAEVLEQRQMLTSIGNGQEVLSSFLSGSSRSFDFQAEADSTVLVYVGETTPANAVSSSVVLQVFDPGGGLVGTRFSGNSATLQFDATTSGTYTAVVSEQDNNNALNFRIRTLVLPGDSAPALIADRDAALSNGEEMESSLPVGGFSIFPFEVSSDSTTLVSVGETTRVNSINSSVVLQVFGPGGTWVGTRFSSDSATLQFDATTSGTYTAVVSELDDNNALNFRIRTLVLPGDSDPVLLVDRDAALSNGEEMESSLPVGGFNVYPFEVPADSTALVSVGETTRANSISSSVVLRVFGPGGELVGIRFSDDSAALQFDATTSGTYTAVVSELDDNNALNFLIRTLVLPGDSAPGLMANRDAVLTDGQEVESSLPRGSYSVFPFDAIAGQTILTSVVERDTGNSLPGRPFLQIHGPDGEVIRHSWDFNEASLELEVTASGRYTAVVWDNENDTAFDFSIRLDVLSPAKPVITSPTGLTRSDDNRLAVTWNAVEGANRYEIYYTRVATGESGYINEFTTQPSFTPSAPLPIGRYWIWVRVHNTDGQTSPWSEGVNLQVTTPPVLQTPEFHQQTVRPSLNWTAIDGATEYDLWVNNLTTQESRVIRRTDLQTNSFTAQADLGFGLYVAWVRGIDSSGLAAGWSQGERFYIGPQFAEGPSATFDRTPTLNWSTQTGDVTYEVYTRDANGTVIRESGLTTPEWTPDSELPIGRTVWWVLPTLNGSRRGQWSPRLELFVGGRSQVTAPTGTFATLNPMFEWEEVSGAGSYEIFVQRLSDEMVWRQTFVGQTAGTLSEDLSHGDFRVWILAFSSSGERGYWSVATDFTISG